MALQSNFLVSSKRLADQQDIAFLSSPMEWCAPMLGSAALYLLDLADRLFENGFGLSEATPFHIAFQATQPVFVKSAVIEKRNSHDATWNSFRQFVSTFLYPLLVNSRLGKNLDEVYTQFPNGLAVADVYRMIGPIRRWLPPYFPLVTVPTLLAHRSISYRAKLCGSPREAGFVFRRLTGFLRKQVELIQSDRGSAKLNVGKVEKRLLEQKSGRVLILGQNGTDAAIQFAAKGWRVVAADADRDGTSRLWRAARSKKLDLLPLVVSEIKMAEFLKRAAGKFDLVVKR